jgi:hypothetical protein
VPHPSKLRRFAVVLSLAMAAGAWAGDSASGEDAACVITPAASVGSDVLTCACGDAIEPEDVEDVEVTPVPSCSVDDFDHGLCCEEGDGCRCNPIACGRNADGFCSCYPEYVFDFDAEDERVDACEPQPGGECCLEPIGGLCFCGSGGCGVGETIIASCTPESVQCFEGKSEVDACP